MPSAPDSARHDDAGDGRCADLPSHPRKPRAERHDGGFPLGAGRGAAAAGGLRRGSRRLPHEADQDEAAGEPRAGDSQTHRRRRGPRRTAGPGHHDRPRPLHRDPRRAGNRPAAQGIRAARPALLVAGATDPAGGDLRQDLGHGGGRRRPHDRCPHPQAAPEDRRRTHRDGQGRGIQI